MKYIGSFWILFICLASNAQGNYKLENFGNKSLLLSGNVTGGVDDLGLTYYNPARIALVDNPAFSISAKGFQLNSIEVENVFGNQKNLSDSKFNAIPSLVAGTFEIKSLKNHFFAYSFISKMRSDYHIQYSSEIQTGDYLEGIDGLETFIGDVNLNSKFSDDWYGLTWGMKLAENLGIGVSGFLSIYSLGGSNKLKYAILEETNDVSLYNNDISFEQDSYGMFWKVGLAWKVSEIDLGLNIDLPYWEFTGSGAFNYQKYFSNSGKGDDIFGYAKYENLSASRKTPLGVSIGASIPFSHIKIHLNVDWHDKLESYDRIDIPIFEEELGELKQFVFEDELNSVVNFGIGAEFFINTKLGAFASFSTDFSAAESNANIFDLINDTNRDTNLTMDYYHFGTGIDMTLSWAKLILGVTYSRGSTDFSQPIDFPQPEPQVIEADDLSKLTITRWRMVIGLEIPIFGQKVEVK